MAEHISEELLESVEKRVDDLRNWFEQYFLGTRKRAPLQERTSLQYLIRRMSNQSITSTRLRFRFQQIVSKFNSYDQYWTRTMQKIETGTHFRDRFKAKLRAQEDPAPPPPPPGAAKRASSKAGAGDKQVDQVYDEFIKARKQCNQGANISKEKLAETIKKQTAALQQKYKGKQVNFKVVVEGGQAKLKATLK